MKFSDKSRNVNLELPVKINFEGKDYWVKKATKTSGLYMNDIPPKDVLLPITNNLRKQDKVQ